MKMELFYKLEMLIMVRMLLITALLLRKQKLNNIHLLLVVGIKTLTRL